MQATSDLENYDKDRHDEFKRYEMMKEHERRERLKNMNEEDRTKEEQHYEEMKKKHADHPKVNHPVSKKQNIILSVWEDNIILNVCIICILKRQLAGVLDIDTCFGLIVSVQVALGSEQSSSWKIINNINN